jgi:nitroreductase
MEAIDALTTRASPLQLTEPAPDRNALNAMLRAAAKAPDHGRLHPWRFIVIEGTARDQLGEVLAAALRAREPGLPEAVIEKERTKPRRAPLLVVVAARIRDNKKIPAVEQIISAGAAAQNILVAAHSLGFGGFWRTGPAAYDDHIKTALGLAASDSIVGFLYLGTPAVAAPPTPAPDLAELVTEWTGPQPSREDSAAR